MATEQPKQPPKAQKAKKVRGVVFIDPARCKGCGFCVAFCPPQVLAFSEEFNPHGYHTPYLADPDRCTGCDLCGMYCPDFAIFAVMVKLEKKAVEEEAATRES